MIKGFPIDYMHLICLGVVRKMLGYWVKRATANKAGKLAIRTKNKIQKELKELSSFFPKEFNRNSYNFLKPAKWKATQARSFLLYVGIVVLKGYIDERIYKHFLLLHVATTICMSESHSAYIDIADEMFKDFINEFSNIYGKEYISPNVHNLGHIVDDVREFGVLDNFASFKFENFLGILKRLLRSGRLPLQQGAKRLYEKFLVDLRNRIAKNEKPIEHPSIHSIKFENFTISHKKGDKWFLTKDKNIIEFKSVVVRDNETFIIGRKLRNKTDLYTDVIDSRFSTNKNST